MAVHLFRLSRGPYGSIQHLPHGGGLLDQSALLMTAYDIIEPLFIRLTKKD